MSNGDLLTAFLAALSPTSAIAAVIITNRYAEKRFQRELRSRICESLVSERRESILRINELMTRCQSDVIGVKHLERVQQPSDEKKKRVSERLDSFWDEIFKCSIWFDETLHETLLDVYDSQRALLESVPADWKNFGTSFRKAQAALKESLGISEVDRYLKIVKESG